MSSSGGRSKPQTADPGVARAPSPRRWRRCWVQTGKGGVARFTPLRSTRRTPWSCLGAGAQGLGKGGEAGGVEARVAAEGMWLVEGHCPMLSKSLPSGSAGAGSPLADTLGTQGRWRWDWHSPPRSRARGREACGGVAPPSWLASGTLAPGWPGSGAGWHPRPRPPEPP